MQVGDIVFLRYGNNYVKNVIKQAIDDDFVIITVKTHILNCVPKSDLISAEEFEKIYNNELIYE